MLQFAKVFSRLRKTHGLTQEQIAQYVGVSKAAVSQWETGLSYPDILLLPKLATYLNVSIDTLLGYQPQMTAAQIREIYQRLAHDFATKPFDDVYQKITQLTDEYYSCFALINELNVLLLNYVNLAPQKDIVRFFKLTIVNENVHLRMFSFFNTVRHHNKISVIHGTLNNSKRIFIEDRKGVLAHDIYGCRAMSNTCKRSVHTV